MEPERPAPAAGAERPVGFKRHLRVEPVPGEGVYVLADTGVRVLDGAAAEALAPLLDGTRTLPEVVRDACAVLPAAEAGQGLAALGRAGLLGTRGPDDGAGAAHAYWDAAGIDGSAAVEALAATVVDVVAVGAADTAAARAACRAAGLVLAAPGGPADLTLVLCEDYLRPELAEVDAAHRAAGRTWLPARTTGAEVWVGPFFGPASPDVPEPACWECLAHRLRAHRSSQNPVRRVLGLAGPVPLPPVALPSTAALGVQLAVLELAKWAAGLRRPGQSAVTVLDTLTLSSTPHPVRRRPQCPRCGDPSLVARRVNSPFVPASRPKHGAQGGNHRALPLEEVYARHRHLVSPVTGAVSAVRPAAATPDGLYHYVSGRNLALGGRDLAGLRSGLRSHSGGKGVSAREAEVGALCEALERYSGTRQGDEPVVRDSLRGLGGAALHPNSCQLYATAQFADRARWNQRYAHSAFQQIPEPFDPGAAVEWTPVWSLTAGGSRLLPTSMLYFGPGPDGVARSPWADSNGNAAGASPEDALVQGFLELVERDAVALWWYNRTRRAAVDLDAFDEPWLAATRAAYARAGREVWALDVTSDFGIPVVVALSRRTDGGGLRPEDISFGFGAHFDPRLALRRAVTELAQLLPPTDPGADRAQYAGDPEVSRWWDTATLAGEPHLVPDAAESPRTPACWGYRPTADLREDVATATELVRARGLDLLVLDQTRPDIGLPVVKAIVPGMRHFWARFAPGRLFDVPVEQGLLTVPTAYRDLNPTPLFA
ncbi:TOMM precursor leader peptide-binding protein [Streptomyces sp. NPDC087440]|uniref:TOMM precursor leader peptide-binding protein n=1 Tax=Streptomyces sp. NPDC087440 TaxID=3365790 RepID=UPI00381E3FD3